MIIDFGRMSTMRDFNFKLMWTVTGTIPVTVLFIKDNYEYWNSKIF
jgi:hypothetical protein